MDPMAAVASVALIKLGGHHDLCGIVAFMIFVIIIVLYICCELCDCHKACRMYCVNLIV